MADLVQRPTPSREPGQRPQVKGVKERRPSEKEQQWAIGQAEALAKTTEQLESHCRAEMGMQETCETIDSPVRNMGLSDMSGPLPDDDFYDFEEYGEDNPVSDPDAPSHLKPLWDKNDLDALDAGNEPEPFADIIIDEFGNVEIPREELLETYYGGFPDESSPLTTRGLQLLITAQMLRAVGEALVEKEGDLILSREADFSKVNLLPLTQEALMIPLGITDAPTRARVTDRYIKTPYWGTLHLSAFFQGVSEEWKTIVKYVRELVEGEDPENPYANKIVWNDIRQRYSLAHNSNRQLRNELIKAGIPLKKPRKEIYGYTKNWKEEEKVKRVNISDIPGIRTELQDNYGLFDTGQTRQCREEQYIPFVEDRIMAVLKTLGVEVR